MKTEKNLDGTTVRTLEPEDLAAWLLTLDEACRYLQVMKDFVPHNTDICRHIGKLDRMRVDLKSVVG